MKVLVTQSWLTFCDPKDYSLPGSSVHGILQAIILERVAFLLSRGSSWLGYQTLVSCPAGRFFIISPRWYSGEESAWQCRECRKSGFHSWVRKIPWSRKWQPVPVFLLGKSHGQKSLTSYSPWGHKESDTTAYSTLLDRSFFQGPVSRALLTTRGLVQSDRNQLLLIFLTFWVCLSLSFNIPDNHISPNHFLSLSLSTSLIIFFLSRSPPSVLWILPVLDCKDRLLHLLVRMMQKIKGEHKAPEVHQILKNKTHYELQFWKKKQNTFRCRYLDAFKAKKN